MHLLRMFICNILSKGLEILEINSVVTEGLGHCVKPTLERLSCMNCYMKQYFVN